MTAPPVSDSQESGVILIAEDEQAIADVVCTVVEDAGFRPVVVRHGQEALELARAERPVLVITDLMMPHLTGADLIAALRADAEANGEDPIPVILITAANSTAARAAGADVVLYKPFNIDALEALMRRFIEKCP